MLVFINRLVYLCNQQSNKTDKGKRKAAGPESNHLSFIYGKGTTFFRFRNKKVYDMKKNRISDILGIICVAFVFAGCVEGLDGGVTIWTVFCLIMAGLFGWLSKKTEEAK